MSDGIHRFNDLIKQVPGLKYDCSVGNFETDRRALYDFAELIVRECADVARDNTPDTEECEYTHLVSEAIKRHFGVGE